MPMKFFRVPIHSSEQYTQELNTFLTSKKVVTMERNFVQEGMNSFWAICVEYIEEEGRPKQIKNEKVDYRKILNDADFALFARLREIRKKLAENEGVPAYAIFTNEQLAEIVKRKVTSLSALNEISGVGNSRAQKYGSSFFAIVKKNGGTASESYSGNENMQ